MYGIMHQNKLLRLDASLGFNRVAFNLSTDENNPIYLAATKQLAASIINQAVTISFLPTHPEHDFNPDYLRVVQVDIIIQEISK